MPSCILHQSEVSLTDLSRKALNDWWQEAEHIDSLSLTQKLSSGPDKDDA